MLKVIDLHFKRSDKVILSNIGFSLNSGELLHVLGENGSGKTTLLRILTGLLIPEQGEICWEYENVSNRNLRYKAETLYISHLNGLKDDLSALENLQSSAQMRGDNNGKAEIKNALISTGVGHYMHTNIGILSQGQKRRVALAYLWLTKCKLWILDEPFVSLDANSIQAVLNRISKHIQNGGMVILTSHQEVSHPSILAKTLRLGF